MNPITAYTRVMRRPYGGVTFQVVAQRNLGGKKRQWQLFPLRPRVELGQTV